METKQKTNGGEEVNVMDLSDKQRNKFNKECQKLFVEERQIYDIANDLTLKLGLNGLWRGRDATIVLIAKAIKKGGEK